MKLTNLSFSKWRYFRSLESSQLYGLRFMATAPALKTAKKSALKPVIGLEIHAQIMSNTKLFSGADSQFGSRVNSNVSHFDAAIPGTLPVINRRCVEAAVVTSLALGCKISLDSRFDRKHYFYADMPAGYQITQHFHPIARNGKLEYVVVPKVAEGAEEADPVQRSIRIIQVQIEQDSGKSIHDAVNGVSLIDLNRAGHGLLEIVTAPDFKGSEDAVAFASELKLLLECLGVTDSKSSGGQTFRVDANVSLHRDGEPLGVRTEIKNMNSLKDVRNSIEFEIGRQRGILESGAEVENETLGFDRLTARTLPMRDKEMVTDYRFFPEPNLPPLRLSTSRRTIPGAVDVDLLASQLPELPEDVRRRLMEKWRLTRRESVALVAEERLTPFFENVMECLEDFMPNFLEILPRELVPLPPPPKPCAPLWTQFWPFINPSLCLTVTQTVANILLKRVLPHVESREKLKIRHSSSTPSEDLTIEDLPISHRQVAELATLIEGGNISAAAAPSVVDKLMERDAKDDSSLKDLVDTEDLWISDDRDWIRSLVIQNLTNSNQAKQLVRDNPKKIARAKMEVIGRTIVNSGLKAHPMVVKSIVEEEVEKLRNSRK